MSNTSCRREASYHLARFELDVADAKLIRKLVLCNPENQISDIRNTANGVGVSCRLGEPHARVIPINPNKLDPNRASPSLHSP